MQLDCWKKLITLTALGLLEMTTVCQAANETLLCIPDASTGFATDGDRWVRTNFIIKDQRYLVKPVPETDIFGRKVNYEVSLFGEKNPQHHCFRYPNAENLYCDDGIWGFKVNFRTMRFLDYYVTGYIDGVDTDQNTPALTIGKCSPL